MKKFALTGLSIAHSKSPVLFRAAYPAAARAYAYELLPAHSAEEAMRLFHAHNLTGMNITAPFKGEILRFADTQSEVVRFLGAANTLVRKDGQLHAENTDVDGVLGALRHHHLAPEGASALVLGAGGAGKAAVYALKHAGAQVVWANRTAATTEHLAAHYGVRAVPLAAVPCELPRCTLLVNTLPAAADVLRHLPLQQHHTILDADYAGHADRPLFALAEKNKAAYISGLFWLLYQAVPAFWLFTGEEPSVENMRQVL
jgi:shikimate dehydrogenase